MLYRTQNPFSFRFNAFSLAPPPSALALPSPVQRVECLEGIYRRGEMDDFLVNNGQNDASGEDFFVENFLVDGQDVFIEEGTADEHVGEAGDKNPSPLSVLPETNTEQRSISTPLDDFGSVPGDDVENLEWLSHFVEDSFSGYSMTYQTENILAPTSEPKPILVQANDTTSVQTKARTKRARTGGRVWSLTGSSSSTSSSTTDSDTWLIYPGQTADSLIPQPKNRKKRVSAAISPGGTVAVPRRCGHCGVTKTPQWRAGPLGAKTLCNACGVRFKSGRLFPEYRPACSPTFSSEMHSNNHRKVLEMRRQKDAQEINFN